jgi:DNA-binding MarR family transcriptional regulator
MLKMYSKKIRKHTGGLSELQTKILLLRGFTSEEVLLSQTEIAKQLTKSITTINYNIKSLREKGLITQLNYLTPDGKALFLKLKDSVNNTNKLRAHKISGKFILNEDYTDFDNVKNKYVRISSSPKHKGFKIEFRGCIILFYSPKTLMFYLPDIYADTIEQIYADAYEKYVLILESYLKQLFPNLKINTYEIASVTINHLAYTEHPLAQLFNELNVQYASDRLEIDHSHGVPELETIHKDYAVQDMDLVLEFEGLIRSGIYYRYVSHFNAFEIQRKLIMGYTSKLNPVFKYVDFQQLLKCTPA